MIEIFIIIGIALFGLFMGFAYLMKQLFDMCRNTGDVRSSSSNALAIEEYLNPVNHYIKKYNYANYRDSTTEKGHPVLPTCCICMEDYKEEENEEMICHCFHAFHTECLSEWFYRGRPVCPVCNYDLRTGEIVQNSLTSITQSVSQNPDDQINSSSSSEGIVLLMNEDTSKTIQNIISNPYSNPVIPSNPSSNSIIL